MTVPTTEPMAAGLRPRPVVIPSLIAFGVLTAVTAPHLVQTWLWYDGLAQDVPIWSSQGSVIVMLVLILFLETPRRGLWLVGTVAERLFRSSDRPAERAQKDAGAYG